MTKHILKTSALAAALMLCTGAAQAIDIAVNGGFETGDFTGWTQFPQTGTQTVVTPGNGSTYAANLVVPVRGPADPPVDNVIKNANLQAGFLTPFAPITVTWDMKGSLSGDGGVVFIELFSELSGGGVSKADTYLGGPIFPNADWTSYSWTTTLGPDVSGGATLQLKTACGPVVGCGTDIFFDNVTITTSVVPVPAAVWLFGSGLVGLVGIARRKKAA